MAKLDICFIDMKLRNNHKKSKKHYPFSSSNGNGNYL